METWTNWVTRAGEGKPVVLLLTATKEAVSGRNMAAERGEVNT